MGSTQTITLFSNISSTGQRSSSFLLSLLMHGLGAGLISLGIFDMPQLAPPLAAQHYDLRHLDLRTPEPRPSSGGSVSYPGPVQQTVHVSQSKSPPPGAKPQAPAPPLPETAQANPAKQTLLQPDVRNPVVLAEKIPLPSVVIWSPEKTPVKSIVPPQPQKPTAADVTPSITPPNEEVTLSDLGISSSDLSVQDPLIQATITSPVVLHDPKLLQLPPVTTSDSTAEPTPATVVSLSNLRMDDGMVTLPPANQTAPASAPGSLVPGQTADAAPQPNPGPPGGSAAQAAGQGTGGVTVTPSTALAPPGQGVTPGPTAGPGSGAGSPSATVISLPHDGQFGSVIVGDSIGDVYPEVTDLWSNRMAYTVYLHVGLAKSWILQYSLPATADAASAGEVARIDAPWPYNIVRPNIPAGSVDADALMIHGFINQSGRFDTLSVAFPSDYAQAQFVLGSLQQWQFRPAAQDGKPVRVEVMLIIPESSD